MGNPIKSEVCPPIARFPSHLGADSASVLQDLLGLSAEQTRDLADCGIIGAHATA